MTDSIKTLNDFIEAARRSRKYADNTAMALKTALRLFEKELNEEERGSVEKFKENLDRIYQSVFEKNKTKFSSGSLDTYRRRISKLINDYLNYGVDPAKMNSWSPPVRKITVGARNVRMKSEVDKEENPENEATGVAVPEGSTRLDWPLGAGRKAILILPAELSSQEAETIKSLVNLRVAKEGKNEEGQSTAT